MRANQMVQMRLFRSVSLFFSLLLLIAFPSGLQTTPTWPPKHAYFDQPIDHFNFYPYSRFTFKQLYLYEDKFYKPGGPIFFYCGNEGPIKGFWNNTGFMFDIAGKFNALIVFGEHRFYGETVPFGAKSFQQPLIGFLSIEQALADYVYLIDHIKKSHPAIRNSNSASHTRVITFGGSYGGMLAAYMRFKYSNIVSGAIAASCPLTWLADQGRFHEFFETIAKDLKNAEPNCDANVKKAFQTVLEFARRKEYKKIASAFNLCAPPSNAVDVDYMLRWARNAFVSLAMFDYPYASHFGTQLPGNPIKAACKRMNQSIASGASPTKMMRGLSDMIGLIYGNSRAASACHKPRKEYFYCADITGCGLGSDSKAWDFQACTEVNLYDGSNATASDVFPSLPQPREDVDRYCMKKWNVTRNENLRLLEWGRNVKSATNVFYSNGDLDPWGRGGIPTDYPLPHGSISKIVMGGAHHLDLRGSNPADPPGVIKVRNLQQMYIRRWLR